MSIISFKNLQQIYALLICFVLVFIILLSSIMLIDNLVKIKFPELKITKPLSNFDSDENYLFYLQSESVHGKGEIYHHTSLNQLMTKRLYEKKILLEEMTRSGLSGLVSNLQWLFMSIIFL